MIVSKNVKSLSVLSAAVALSVAGLAAPLAAQADLTGNINVVSKYVLRGITDCAGCGTENTGAAVQGGFDYSHSSGIYAGYWGSSLSYGSKTAGAGFENDLYAGYKGKVGPMSYGVGVIYYAYSGIADQDAAEVALTGGLGNGTLGINYLTKDVAWGNSGDIYLTLGYTQPLPSDFSLAGTLMYYVYDTDGEFFPESPDAIDSGFRGISVTLSHPLTKTSTMGLTVVGGGEDRFGNYQPGTMVLSLGATF
jgi:uncharacterized protein (TIGR02001 family)